MEKVGFESGIKKYGGNCYDRWDDKKTDNDETNGVKQEF